MAEQQEDQVCQFCLRGKEVQEVLHKNNTCAHLACMVQCKVPKAGASNRGLISPNRRLKEVNAVLKAIKSKDCEVCSGNSAGIKCCIEECDNFMHLPCTPQAQCTSGLSCFEDEEFNYKFHCRRHFATSGVPDVKIELLNSEDGGLTLENTPQAPPPTVEDEAAAVDLKATTEFVTKRLQEMQIVGDVKVNQIPKITPFILTEDNIKQQKEGTENICHVSAGVHFQVLVMLDVILELRLRGYQYTATFEKRATGAFDDVCVEYSRPGQHGEDETVKLFIQVKHGSRKLPESIKFSEMFKEIKSMEDYDKKKLEQQPFHQLKHFKSFYNHSELQEKNSKIIFFTNRKFETSIINFQTEILLNFTENFEELKDLNLKAYKFNTISKDWCKYLKKIGISKDNVIIYEKAKEYFNRVLFVVDQPNYSKIVSARILPKIERDLEKLPGSDKSPEQAYHALFTWATAWFDSITSDRNNRKDHLEINQKFNEVYNCNAVQYSIELD